MLCSDLENISNFLIKLFDMELVILLNCLKKILCLNGRF
jgi:hypothetical protein